MFFITLECNPQVLSTLKYALGHKSLRTPCFRWTSTYWAFDAQRTCTLFILDIVILFFTYSVMKATYCQCCNYMSKLNHSVFIIALSFSFLIPLLLCTLSFSVYLVLDLPANRVLWSECRLLCQVVNFVSLVISLKFLLFL